MGVKDKKWFQAIQKIAPKIAGALGGPFGGLAESVLSSVLGMNSEQAMEEIAKGNPEVFAKLKQAEIEMEARMKELDIQEQDLYLKDVSDARARQVATKDWTPAILTFLAILFFGIISYAILFESEMIMDTNEKFVWYLLGAVNAFVVQGFNFFLGSSKGSQRKTDILANGHGRDLGGRRNSESGRRGAQ
jgi:hypothetical protein